MDYPENSREKLKEEVPTSQDEEQKRSVRGVTCTCLSQVCCMKATGATGSSSRELPSVVSVQLGDTTVGRSA